MLWFKRENIDAKQFLYNIVHDLRELRIVTARAVKNKQAKSLVTLPEDFACFYFNIGKEAVLPWEIKKISKKVDMIMCSSLEYQSEKTVNAT